MHAILQPCPAHATACCMMGTMGCSACRAALWYLAHVVRTPCAFSHPSGILHTHSRLASLATAQHCAALPPASPQSLCEVCSVNYSHVCNLAAGIDPPPIMVDLNPMSLEDVIADVSGARQ